MMEKRGVIDENTPQCGCEEAIRRLQGEPLTKEAADEIEKHPVNDMIDAVADRSAANRK